MSDSVHLSRDAARLLVLIYQRYLNSKHDGLKDFESRYVGDTLDVIRLFSLDPDEWYVTDLLFELTRAGYIYSCAGDNLANECTLERAGIARMERLWVDALGSLAKALTAKALDAITQALL